MYPTRTHSPARPAPVGAAGRLAVLAGLAALAGLCDRLHDDDDAPPASDRPAVTFTATEDSLTVPAEVPSGLVDITWRPRPAATTATTS